MAKARITNKGNVQVVMSQEQWMIVNEIFNHVRMGNRNIPTKLFSDLVIDLSDFNQENEFDFDIDRNSEVEVYVTRENKYGEVTRLDEFSIELGESDDDNEDWD